MKRVELTLRLNPLIPAYSVGFTPHEVELKTDKTMISEERKVYLETNSELESALFADRLKNENGLDITVRFVYE